MLNSNSPKSPPKETAKRYPRSTVRLGELESPLVKRATSETKASGRKVTPSAIIKRALRAYLGDGTGQHFDATELIEAVKKLRADLARVGGNLNQLAHTFNIYSQIDEADRDRTFKELQGEFREIITVMREVEGELYKRR